MGRGGISVPQRSLSIHDSFDPRMGRMCFCVYMPVCTHVHASVCIVGVTELNEAQHLPVSGVPQSGVQRRRTWQLNYSAVMRMDEAQWR